MNDGEDCFFFGLSAVDGGVEKPGGRLKTVEQPRREVGVLVGAAGETGVCKLAEDCVLIRISESA